MLLQGKHLLFSGGLTLSVARKRLVGEGVTAVANEVRDDDVAARVDSEMRDSPRAAWRGLHWMPGARRAPARAAEKHSAGKKRAVKAPAGRAKKATKSKKR